MADRPDPVIDVDLLSVAVDDDRPDFINSRPAMLFIEQVGTTSADANMRFLRSEIRVDS